MKSSKIPAAVVSSLCTSPSACCAAARISHSCAALERSMCAKSTCIIPFMEPLTVRTLSLYGNLSKSASMPYETYVTLIPQLAAM